MEFLTVEHISKQYGKGETQVNALDDVSFTIPKGQMAAIIGPSGSGKSTLLHILGGVDRPTSGKVYLDGQDVFAQNNKNLAIFRRRQVGLIYQFYNLIPVLSAVENITLPVIMDGRKPDREYLSRLLELLNLSDRKDHLPSQLSGGQQQRVSIGRALFTSPSIILADEPTGNLDAMTGADILRVLSDLSKGGVASLVMVTHSPDAAMICDRTLTLEDGVLKQGA